MSSKPRPGYFSLEDTKYPLTVANGQVMLSEGQPLPNPSREKVARLKALADASSTTDGPSGTPGDADPAISPDSPDWEETFARSLDPIAGEDSGIEPSLSALTNPSNHAYGAHTALTRCDFFYAEHGSVPLDSASGEMMEYLDTLAPRNSYYYPALTFLPPSVYLGLYTWRDLALPVTQAELALHKWAISTPEPSLDSDSVAALRALTADEGLGITTVTLSKGTRRSVDLNLSSYPRAAHSFTSWLHQMYSGARGIPLPLALALLADSSIPNTRTGITNALVEEVSIGAYNSR